MAEQTWKGSTADVKIILLDASFRVEGRTLRGVYQGEKEMAFGGEAYKLDVDEMKVNGHKTTEVELAPLTGLKMALDSLRERGYFPEIGDMWEVKCVGVKKAKNADMSDRVNFELSVVRPE